MMWIRFAKRKEGQIGRKKRGNKRIKVESLLIRMTTSGATVKLDAFVCKLPFHNIDEKDRE